MLASVARAAATLRSTRTFASKVKCSAPPVVPKSPAQKKYWSHLQDANVAVVVVSGSAGTGKTLLAVESAINHLESGAVRRIILARPAVSAGEDLGFLPGSAEDKLRPWIIPLYDVLHRHYSPGRVKTLMESNKIELCPIAFMRGRTFDDAFVVVDEAQNATDVQFRMIVTRLGLGSKMVLTGDPNQVDLRAGQRSGLIDFLERVDSQSPVSDALRIVNLGSEDCERHPVVRDMLSLYE